MSSRAFCLDGRSFTAPELGIDKIVDDNLIIFSSISRFEGLILTASCVEQPGKKTALMLAGYHLQLEEESDDKPMSQRPYKIISTPFMDCFPTGDEKRKYEKMLTEKGLYLPPATVAAVS